MTLTEARQTLNITVDLVPAGNSNRPGTPLNLTAITIHNTDNDEPGADAAAHAKYMKGEDARHRAVSWHFTVDDRQVYQSLPIREVGWHAVSGNSQSLGIEICENRGIDQGAANDRAALLTAVLLKEQGLPVARVFQHNHWTGKDCPALLRHPESLWAGFLAQVQTYLDSLTGPGGDECTLACSPEADAAPAALERLDDQIATALAPVPRQIDTLEEAYYDAAAGRTKIRPVKFYDLPGASGRFHLGSMAIDVDGSPRAYYPGDANPLRLDKVANTDLAGSSTTYIQGVVHNGHLGIGPRKGFYVSGTSLRYKGSEMWDCGNFLDAEVIPFTVYPASRSKNASGAPIATPIELGGLCVVVDIKTMRWTPAIVGDTGSGPRVSECSLRVAVNLGKSTIDPHTLQVHGLTGGNGDDVRHYFYLYFPGQKLPAEPTAPHWPEDAIRAAAEPLFTAWGGIDMVKACLELIS